MKERHTREMSNNQWQNPLNVGCYMPFLGQGESSDSLGSVLVDMGTFNGAVLY
ncbi:hypothetical protein L0P88_00695 [Muricauda sp. SCSIO 64092]|uniref:hypothetical protein n=1 Tax=Allomuricauda sp. SCSIO 64092 TaxID=2908842 RepID=UPI001FF62ACC|nr:hypothetical protein [Muricauda sp. SCSIO 64092]UOY07083.1 hypothetical protein L0P88_00695 [Muricauda sp. SCSIO 64092]